MFKIHHIGYLVKKIERAKELFQGLGYTLEKEIIYDSFRDVDICFLRGGGVYRIELVSPRSIESVVGKLRVKIGNSPYHICYEVENLEKCIDFLRGNKYVIWEEPHEAVALENRRVAFLMSGQIGMIELLESGRNN